MFRNFDNKSSSNTNQQNQKKPAQQSSGGGGFGFRSGGQPQQQNKQQEQQSSPQDKPTGRFGFSNSKKEKTNEPPKKTTESPVQNDRFQINIEKSPVQKEEAKTRFQITKEKVPTQKEEQTDRFQISKEKSPVQTEKSPVSKFEKEEKKEEKKEAEGESLFNRSAPTKQEEVEQSPVQNDQEQQEQQQEEVEERLNLDEFKLDNNRENYLTFGNEIYQRVVNGVCEHPKASDRAAILQDFINELLTVSTENMESNQTNKIFNKVKVIQSQLQKDERKGKAKKKGNINISKGTQLDYKNPLGNTNDEEEEEEY